MSRATRGRLASLGVRAASIVAIAALTLAACQAQPSAEPLATIPVRHAYSICPAGGQLPAPEITDRAVAILRERLRDLGVDAPTFKVEACIEIETPITADDTAIQAAVLGTGRLEIIPVPADQIESVKIGGAPPEGVQPLVAGADITSSEVGIAAGTNQPTLTILLSDAGSAAMATWTTAHVGEMLALAVDGVVGGVPTVDEPITAGEVQLTLTAEPLPVPLRTIGAMIESGPLPPEWAQPERPQG